MRRGQWRSAFLMAVMSIALAACGTSGTATATPRPVASATSGVTGSFVLATLVSGPTGTPLPARPTNTLAPRPTTFPTSTPIPRVGSGSVTAPTSRPSGSANASPTGGASTSAAMNGRRSLTNASAAYQVSYPEAWSVTTQSMTVTISPETGTARLAGFLIETVRNPKLSPEDDLRDAVSANSPYIATGQIAPVMVAGEPGFRTDVRISLGATPTAQGSATVSGPMYTGSIITTSHKGVSYRIGLFARDGDTMVLDQAEQVLASLRFT